MLIKIRIINEEKWRNIIKIRIKIIIINGDKRRNNERNKKIKRWCY